MYNWLLILLKLPCSKSLCSHWAVAYTEITWIYYFLWQDIYIVMTLRLKLPSQKYCLDLGNIKWCLSLVPYQKRCAKNNNNNNNNNNKNHIVLNPTFKSFQNSIFRTFGSQVFVSNVLNFPSYVYPVIHPFNSTYMYSSVLGP